MTDFENALKETFDLEGGFSNDLNDRGGKTKYGITEFLLDVCIDRGYLPNMKIENITKGDAELIYYKVFWEPLCLNEIQDKLITAEIFDTAVNSSGKKAVKIVQESLNFLGENLKVDGLIGIQTLTLIKKWIQKDKKSLFKCLNGFQFINFVEIVKNDSSQKTFSCGWMKRIQEYQI